MMTNHNACPNLSGAQKCQRLVGKPVEPLRAQSEPFALGRAKYGFQGDVAVRLMKGMIFFSFQIIPIKYPLWKSENRAVTTC